MQTWLTYSWLALTIAAPLGACTTSSADDDFDPESVDDGGGKADGSGHGHGLVQLDQGWTKAERDHYYRDGLGGRSVPKTWFFALQDPTTHRPLAAKDNLEAIGALYEDGNDLPIGFAENDGPGGTWIGANCSMCHNTDIPYKDTLMRVAGGTGKFVFNAWLGKLFGSIIATSADQATFDAFAAALLGTNPQPADVQALRDAIDQTAAKLKPFADAYTALHPVPDGPGRFATTDIFTNVGAAPLDPRNARIEKTYAGAPGTWGSTDYRWFQLDGGEESRVASNALAWSMVDFTYDPNSPSFTTTSFGWNPDNHHLDSEELLAKLEPPAWPEAIVGQIDHAAASRGAKIYKTTCAGCHEPTSDGEYLVANLFTPSQVGTDPTYATAQNDQDSNGQPIERQIYTGALKDSVFGGRDRVGLFSDFFPKMSQLIFDAKLNELGLSASDGKAIAGNRENVWRQTGAYVAKPLRGVWATAPYLHNDSVPTLWELLLPADKRVKKFYIGGDFQPATVGYSVRGRTGFQFDTALEGNSNQGHEGEAYGTTLSNRQRLDLLEYLKTL